jgi:disulfide bond formation protein DsbB
MAPCLRGAAEARPVNPVPLFMATSSIQDRSPSAAAMGRERSGLRSPAVAAALVVAAASAGAIIGAYFFEYVVDVPPCPLCLDQRIPHYIAVPLGLAVAAAAAKGAPRWLVATGLAALALALLTTAGIGAYHAGVEWKFWPGPSDCTGPITGFGNAGTLLEQIQQTSVVRCDEVRFRFLGLSLAGYNAIFSAILAGLAGWAFSRTLRRSA